MGEMKVFRPVGWYHLTPGVRRPILDVWCPSSNDLVKGEAWISKHATGNSSRVRWFCMDVVQVDEWCSRASSCCSQSAISASVKNELPTEARCQKADS